MDEPGAPPKEAPGPAPPTMAPPSASTGGKPLLRSVMITSGRPRHRVRLASPLFALTGGEGFQRPFELATVRLRNMIEVLGHWRTYVPRDDFLTQRGGTDLLEADDSLLHSFEDQGLLGFFATMARPLAFLDPWLPESEVSLIPGTPRTACSRIDGETRD